MNAPKILFLDIETAPIEAYVWQTSIYNASIRIEQVIKDTHLMSFAAKWSDGKIIYADQRKKKQVADDYGLCLQIRNLLHEADVVVAHNGKAFDLRFIFARLAAHGIEPPSHFQQVDTYLEAKKHFAFTYNSLKHLAVALKCKHQKLSHAKFHGMELWVQCLKGNRSAWEEMKEYNIYDVYVLEDVYLKLRPFMVNHPNLGVFVDSKSPVCPKCGGKVQSRGVQHARTGIYPRYQCQKCAGWSRGRKILNAGTHKNNQLVN
jgi:DNA polymerase elongation subunit (family B)/predicted RNA-binding Zn-ribbon protein involved in translation (DUF1610 family)